MAKEPYLLSSGNGSLVASLLLLLLVFCSILHANPAELKAQTFEFSLESMSRFYERTAWDTLGPGDIRFLTIGEYYRIPNFLPNDFRRIRSVEEYSPGGQYKITFEVPMVYSFRNEEEKQGAFYVIKERDVQIPGLEIEIESIDAVAEKTRKHSLNETWKSTLVTSFMGQKTQLRERKGLIHVDIPLPLGPLEKILGKGEKTNIDVSGRESITFAGESRRVHPFIGVEGQGKQPLFPSLEMKQELDIRLKGQIGEKVNVLVDHSSSEFAESQNRIRLNYVGFEDDIIQLIELGNTSLTLPGGQVGGISAASKGLFGIKMLAQMGSVDITMIASKQEGEASSASFTPTGGAIGQTESRRIADIDFVKNTFFFFNHPDSTFNWDLKKPDPARVEVFISVTESDLQQDPNILRNWGRAFVDKLGDGTDINIARAMIEAGLEPPDHELAMFKRPPLEFGVDYRFVLDAEDESVIGLELIRPIEDNRILAVRYVNLAEDIIGNYDEFPPVGPDTLYLELIKPRSPRGPSDTFGYTWDYMIRNIYNLGLTNIDVATLEIEIEDRSGRPERTIPEGEEVPYLRIFGLDRFDESGFPGPDNRVDLLAGLIDPQQGLITFPTLRPFDPPLDSVRAWTADDDSFIVPIDSAGDFAGMANPRLYNKWLSDTELLDARKYDIVVRAASTTRSFRIDAFDIIEGSEVVTLDGRRLMRDVDYTIDYISGEVELKGEAVDQLTPSSQIKIDYEFKPFAGGASSSLLGFNALWNLSKASRIGTTWLYESKSSGSLRPRLGEEPTRAIVGDLYANLQFQSDKLTSVVNVLPLVDTDAQSTVQMNGEIAASFPDPNTRGEVFLDDMEGAEDSDMISLVRRNWWWASRPVDPFGDGFTKLPAGRRDRFFWYNIEPDRGVHRRDLNPDLNEREDNLVTSLDLEFFQTPEDTMWGGLMTGFAGGGLDLSRGQFIEIWINDFKPLPADRNGVVYLELGTIDENFFRPESTKVFHTEDRNRDGYTASTEDTGLDGVPNGQPGDTDDDYSPKRINERLTKINGTEGNYLLDTEDLDRSGILDEKDFYFRYKLRLADSAEVDIRRDFADYDGLLDPNHLKDAWRLYRINLADAELVQKDGIPSLIQVRHMRIWLDSVSVALDTSLVRLQIAGLKIVGNRWEEDGVRDLGGKLIADPVVVNTDFTLGVINTKTEPNKYKPPIIPSRQNDIFEKEQSLFIDYTDLEPGVSFRIKKRFPGNGQDYTRYRDMNFWVYTPVDVLDDSLEYYFQIAFDSLSFYEITAPLSAEYFGPTGWMLAQIRLNDLTSLKFQTPDSVVTGLAHDIVEDRTYRVRLVGNPDLFRVRFLYAGLRNKHAPNQPIPPIVSGELWLNDISLGSVRRDIDFTSTLNGSLNLGNVIKVNTGWRRTGPDYRGLQQRRGSGALTQSMNVNLRTNVQHFIPLFGFSIPISGNYAKTTAFPKFTPSSDTEIGDKALQDSLRTESTGRSFSASLNRKGSKNPLLKYTFDKITANFSMSQTRRRSPTSTDTSTTMNGTFDYQISWGRDRDIRIFKNYKIRYWLNSLSYRLNASRVTGRSYRFVGGRFVANPRRWSASLGQSGSASYVPFRSLTSSFKMTINNDLRIPNKFLGVDVGTEINRNQSLQVNYKPPPIWFVKAFSPDFNYSASYSEDSSPNVRRRGDPAGVRNARSNRGFNVKARFGLGDLFKKIFQKLKLEEKEDATRAGGSSQRKTAPDTKNAGEMPGQPAAKDSTIVGEAGQTPSVEEPKKKRDPLVPFRKLGGILSRIRKVNASIQQRVNSNYSRIPGRPSLKYQLGFTNNSGVTHKEQSYEEPERSTSSVTISFDSGTQITRSIDVAARYSVSRSTNRFKGNETKGKNTNWPDLNFNWKRLEEFSPFRNLTRVASANATLGIRKTRQESGREGTVNQANESITISPSLAAGWKNGLNSTFAVAYSKRTTESRGSKNENSTFTVTVDLKKSFTGGGKGIRLPIPFLSKRLKFKSRLDTSVNMSYSRTGGKRFFPGSDRFEELPSSTALRISPKMTYSFSNQLNGSFFIDYSRQFSDATNQTVTTVRVGISTILTF